MSETTPALPSLDKLLKRGRRGALVIVNTERLTSYKKIGASGAIRHRAKLRQRRIRHRAKLREQEGTGFRAGRHGAWRLLNQKEIGSISSSWRFSEGIECPTQIFLVSLSLWPLPLATDTKNGAGHPEPAIYG